MADVYLLGRAAKTNFSDDRAFERMFEENFETYLFILMGDIRMSRRSRVW